VAYHIVYKKKPVDI